MKTVTVTVLAEDFRNNDYMNFNLDMTGCPLQRAMMRAALIEEGTPYYHHRNYPQNFPNGIDNRVVAMCQGEIPVEDFSFEITID